MKEDKNEENQKKVTLVKINSELYSEAVEIAKADSVRYPSVKNFIENAVRDYINLIKYNIENVDEIFSKDGKPISKPNKEFTKCLVCDKLFLNEKSRNKEGKRVCSRCSSIVKYLAKSV